jgi:hypothetical protein
MRAMRALAWVALALPEMEAALFFSEYSEGSHLEIHNSGKSQPLSPAWKSFSPLRRLGRGSLPVCALGFDADSDGDYDEKEPTLPGQLFAESRSRLRLLRPDGVAGGAAEMRLFLRFWFIRRLPRRIDRPR